MRHLALLAAVYALVAALVLPTSLLASEDVDPATTGTPAAESTPAEEAPAAPTAPAPAPEQPEPAPEQPPAPPATSPEQPAAAPEQAAAAPEPAEEPARKGKARAAASGSVTIADFQFTPAQITVDQGDTVTWRNDGPTPHSATAPDGSFDTGIFPAGQSRSHTFDEAGTFSYICTPHPDMRGTVVVRASQSGDTPDSSAGEGGGTDGSSDSGTGAEAAQGDDGASLPNTGSDSGALLLLGALMLLLGVAVHRRARAEQPRPAGRIGW